MPSLDQAMNALVVRRKLEENRTLRAELERDLDKARGEMGRLLVRASKSKSMTLKDAAVYAGIDYRHAKRLVAEARR